MIILAEEVEKMLNVNYKTVIIGIVIILIGIVAILDLISKISVYINKPVKWAKKRNEDHKAIEEITERIDSLESEMKRNEEIRADNIKEFNEVANEIRTSVQEISEMVVSDKVSRMRNLILDTASRITNNQIVTREQFDEALETYDEYEKFIRDHNMTNGRVEVSHDIIKKKYIELLQNTGGDKSNGNK